MRPSEAGRTEGPDGFPYKRRYATKPYGQPQTGKKGQPVEHAEFTKLCRAASPDYVWAAQQERDVSGGTMTHREIDAMTGAHLGDRVVISGLQQDTFEYFVRTQAHRFRASCSGKTNGFKTGHCCQR